MRLDVRIGENSFNPGLWLVGRIYGAGRDALCADSYPILILAGERILARGFSSAGGNFLLTFVAAGERTRLVVGLERQGKAIVVPLAAMLESGPDWKEAPDAPLLASN
ncbi:MAG: hypothetical protein SFV51_05030 [Bryobacteraceae bacterium]|nr:hypothetical protein [Bryobacteraceae bacterium]